MENTGGNFRKDPGKVARLFLLRNSHVDDDLVAAFKDEEFVLGLRRATQMDGQLWNIWMRRELFSIRFYGCKIGF